VPKKSLGAEHIIYKLREVDVLLALGKTVMETCKLPGFTDQTYYRWRKKYGDMKFD
jgi:putative transposase